MSTVDFNLKFKIVFVFITLLITLSGAYLITQTAFKDLLIRVDKLSTPDNKLVLVNDITRDIIALHQNERIQLTQDRPSQIQNLQEDYSELLFSLYQLKSYFEQNPQQIARIDSIQLLLRNRDQEIKNYIEARFNLGVNPNVLNELEALNKKFPSDTLIQDSEVENKGFFSRVLGVFKKKEKEEPEIIETDTINRITDQDVEMTIKKITEEQGQSVSELLNRDRALQESGNLMINQALSLLNIVENETLRISLQENREAQESVRTSISKTLFIFALFILIISILLYLILRDIRKNNRYRKEIEEAKELAEFHAESRKKFLSHMSHELRTPLQAIIGFSGLLNKEKMDSQTAVRAIQESSEHLLYVVNDILDQSRIESGKITLKESSVDLNTCLTNLLHSIEPLAIEKNLNLHQEFHFREKEIIKIDEFRFKQVLYNLLSNAIKFTDKGEVLLYGNSMQEPYLHLEVRDSGQGIEEENWERIFEEYEQVERKMENPKIGTGLGLNIVKTIVTAMGGRISVRSELGVGSVFTVQLPLNRADEKEDKKEIEGNFILPKVQAEDLNNFTPHIWVLDDDKWIRNLLKEIFTEQGLSFHVFSTAEELFKKDLNPIPTHILTDIRMPQTSGYEVLQHLRGRSEFAQTQIIAFTAEALPVEKEKLTRAGFNDILVKPFREKELFEILKISIKPAKANEDSEIEDLFKTETREDLLKLKKFIEEKEYRQIENILHKLAGRLGQMNYSKLAFQIRKMEIDLRAEDYPSSEAFEKLLKDLSELSQ